MDDFQSDPLWELLGRSQRPEPSPWLATRILAAVRVPGSRHQPALWTIVARWLALPAAAAAAIFTVMALRQPAPAPAPEGAQLFAAFEAFADHPFVADYLWDSASY